MPKSVKNLNLESLASGYWLYAIWAALTLYICTKYLVPADTKAI